MKVEDQETFFKGLNEVKALAEKKYANDPNKEDKVNHAMQNAVAFETYHNDKLQRLVNDFKESDQSCRIDDVLKFYYNHEKLKLHVDLAHLSTALASMHKQDSWYKNFIKYMIGFPYKNPNNTPEINFLLANTLLGDILTISNVQDERADKDAIILKYHPNYKNLSYEEALWKYYSTPDLDKKRDKLYDDAFMYETRTDANTQLNYALFTFGGLALMIVGHSLYKKNKYKYLNQTNHSKKYKIITPNGELYKGKLENPIQKKVVQLKKKIPNKVKQANKTLKKISNSKIKVAQPNYNKKIKIPIAQKTRNIVTKIKNYVTSKPKALKSTNVGKRASNILKKVRRK